MESLWDLICACKKHKDRWKHYPDNVSYETFCGFYKTELISTIKTVINSDESEFILYSWAFDIFSNFIIASNKWREHPVNPFSYGGRHPRKFPDELRILKYLQQEGVCPCCNKRFNLDYMEGDHIYPWSKGGWTAWSNLQMLCKDCNNKKSDTII